MAEQQQPAEHQPQQPQHAEHHQPQQPQQIGFGVYKVPSATCEAVVASALLAGFRHIDTAQVYGNEQATGAAVRAFLAAHPGERVFLTTKVWRLDAGAAPLPPGEAQARVAAGIAQSAAALGLPIDLLLLHAPGASGAARAETWRAMEAAVAAGAVRALGVSNFSEAHLAQLLAACAIRPVVNQLEVHPWLQRRALCAWCAARGILVEAYSPLAKAACLDDGVLAGVAARAGCSPAQALLAWSLAKGYRPLVKTVSAARQRENLARAALSPADIAALDALEEGLVTGWDPVATDPV
jgi:diketogulonate reductase-like aldo/keto reductase